MTEKKIRVFIAKPDLNGHNRGAKVIARALFGEGTIAFMRGQQWKTVWRYYGEGE
jgi:methylmalonyl-CoA mutase cobalamin-binding domain/chain